MYTTQKIESTLELPYHLIDIDTGYEHFIFQFQAFDAYQSDYSIKAGGVTGKFSIIYQTQGIDCCFGCDMTVGNVYEFYTALNHAYDRLVPSETSVAVLKNYGEELHRTNLTIRFDRKGHCLVDGHFQNGENQYKSGILFSLEVDQTYIAKSLHAMELFFQELRRIQGHSNFY